MRATDSSRTLDWRVRLAFVVCLAVTLALGNRWLVTALRFESFGRIWYLYTNYFEFGFLRRSFEGSVIYLLGLRGLFDNPYHLGYVWHGCKLVALAGLAWRLLRRSRLGREPLFAAAFLFSPAFLFHYAFETGSPDLTLVLMVFALAAYDLPELPFILALCAGVLTHELFVFLAPASILLRLRQRQHEGEIGPDTLRNLLAALRLGALPACVLAALFLLGPPAPDKQAYEAFMASLLGPAAHKHPLWSGHWELFTGLHGNLAVTWPVFLDIFRKPQFTLAPLSYALLLGLNVFRLYKSKGRPYADALTLAVLLPLVNSYFATDFYRWVSLSGTLSFLALLQGCEEGEGDRLLLWHTPLVLLLIGLPGPFGNYPIEGPYPLARFLFLRFF